MCNLVLCLKTAYQRNKFKAKNFNLLRPRSDSDGGYHTDPSSSASDSEALFEMLKDMKMSARPVQNEIVEQKRRQSDTTVKGWYIPVMIIVWM